MMRLPLSIKKFIGKIARRYYPNYSYCYRCGRPWKICKAHSTMYSDNVGCFPLCESCWKSLSINNRIRYYFKLWRSWSENTTEDTYNGTPWNVLWDQIHAAVKKGL